VTRYFILELLTKKGCKRGICMKARDSRGFTLIEVIVVAAIIAILVGILVPILFKEIDEAKITRASADVKSISTALIVLKKDTGQWPVSTNCTPTVTLLYGKSNNGTMPTFSATANWDVSSSNTFDNYFNVDDNGCWPSTWKGPYMAKVTSDPWGRAYVTNATEFLTTGNVWILSAGPNGIVETGRGAMDLSGDDIGVRIK
jgi:general secretion pathway protein G